jgi:phosphonate transport system substrate-binding protein
MSKRMLLLLIISVLIVSQAGCGEQRDLPYISLAESAYVATEDPNSSRQSEIRLAIACFASARETILYYEPLVNYLQKNLGMPVELILRGTYAEVNDLLGAGTIDLAYISTYSYILLQKQYSLELLVAPTIAEGASVNSYIIVHKNSGILTFQGLRGKSFAFTDPCSTMGTLYPLYLLKATGETAESFFSSSTYTYSSDNSIRSVANRLVDGAAVNSLVYDYLSHSMPDLFKDISVIHTSPTFSPHPFVVGPALDPALKDRLKTIFLTMHESEEGRSILAELNFKRFIPSLQTAYEEVRAMAEELDGQH